MFACYHIDGDYYVCFGRQPLIQVNSYLAGANLAYALNGGMEAAKKENLELVTGQSRLKADAIENGYPHLKQTILNLEERIRKLESSNQNSGSH